MRYLSLFSGIGGFEVAIENIFGKSSECVAYSEIDKHAILEYQRHYPSHRNLGDVTQVTKKDIDALGKIDLIVGGFPCSDLSSMNHKGRNGLDGEKSGLFWTMLRILKWARKNNPDLRIIIENNASMSHRWRDQITGELTKLFRKTIYCNYFDSSQWVAQRRRRYYWTTKQIPICERFNTQSINDILEANDEEKGEAIGFKILSDTTINYINSAPRHLLGKHGHIMKKVKGDTYTLQDVEYQTRLDTTGSSTLNMFARCIDTRYENSFVLDYRLGRGKMNFTPRYFTKLEISRLFGFPKNYVQSDLNTVYIRLYGMTVVPPVVMYILQNL